MRMVLAEYTDDRMLDLYWDWAQRARKEGDPLATIYYEWYAQGSYINELLVPTATCMCGHHMDVCPVHGTPVVN